MPKSIAAWLQMNDVGVGQPWERPSSERSYLTCAKGLSVVHPVNGGACDADGSWVQYPILCDCPFGPYLKAIAHSRNQLYVPTVWITSVDGFETILDSPSLSKKSVDNLVALAMGRSHDGPWDGVDFDIEGIHDDYKDRLTQWFSNVTDALHAEGLAVSVAATASDRDSGLWYNRHVFDFAALKEFVDTITVMCYTSFGMHPNTAPGPYDLVDRVLAYVLSKGVEPDRLFVGLSVASRYVDYGKAQLSYTSHENVQAILASAGVEAEWYEVGDDDKLFKFKHAAWGDKEAWVIDADTLDAHLSLVDSHGVEGVCLFVLGSETLDAWEATTRWMVRGKTGVRRRVASPHFSDLVGAFYCERSLSC